MHRTEAWTRRMPHIQRSRTSRPDARPRKTAHAEMSALPGPRCALPGCRQRYRMPLRGRSRQNRTLGQEKTASIDRAFTAIESQRYYNMPSRKSRATSGRRIGILKGLRQLRQRIQMVSQHRNAYNGKYRRLALEQDSWQLWLNQSPVHGSKRCQGL